MKRAMLAGTLATASLGVAPVVLGATSAGAASTACYPSCTPPVVSGNQATTLPNTSGDGAATTAANAATPPTGGSSSSLPFTGADVAELAVIGAGTVAVGVVLTRRRRRVTPA
jgi:hypothetical protein